MSASGTDGAAARGMENPLRYPAPVWRRFRAPGHAGRFAPGMPGVASAQVKSQASRAVLELALCFAHGRVVEARFLAYGCPATIAVGDWLCEWSIGRSVEALRGLRSPQIRAALEIGEDRAHCAVMGEDAVRALLASKIPEP